MKKAIAAAAALVVLCSIAVAQEGAAPCSFSFTKGVYDCTFPGVTLDQTWGSMVKAFMTQDMTKHKGASWVGSPVDIDRPSNSMTGTWLVGKGLTAWDCQIAIILEERACGVGAYCTPNRAGKYGKKVFDRFFQRVTELLYGAGAK